MSKLEPPRYVKILFDQYSQNGIMALNDLHKFLMEFQGHEQATKDDAHAIFNSLKYLNIFQRKGLHLEAFLRYLMSDLNAALCPSSGVHQDMKAPLAHYFMFTGHNSYLTGNQLSSDSSVEPIINALRNGVRVIELDLWPNSKKDNVEVRHGGTLTSPVELIKCLHAIKDNAFHASEYPVVITFEDHLTPDLQSKVAKMVTKTFGKMLFCPESDQMKEFPSPESLKKRVMISTKPPKEYVETQNSKEKDTRQKSRKSSKKEHWEDEKAASTIEIEIETETDDKDQLVQIEHIPDEEEEIEYRNLIAIHAGKLKGPLENWLSIDSNKVARLSMSEQEVENATRTNGTDIVRFTQRNLLRVYPKGLRLDSSNYNPFVGWTHGSQMVAFNMQVKVLMGEGWDLDFHRTHFDLYSPPDFFVKLAVAGVPGDKAKRKTGVIKNDWLPDWNEEFEFSLTVPELAVLRIEVFEYDASGKHDFAGQTCYPISELRTGIRAVPLHNRRGELCKNARLLMQFKFACKAPNAI
ncbi:phosphoinositide phospholipase C 2 isoform X2 [Hevea brasiliensis]|uniref:phosphoinositide phospholipase C 2 isoform X2 n=1 Tax=Hevea brasiliensis TaxID=3981 RepID=UPI0025E227B1|nr:phosphoinositide phospholipase C 2 isoform X2 [Hevea brasiliensis]